MSVQTVLGEVAGAELGRTLTHEHLALDFSHFYREPPAPLRDQLAAVDANGGGGGGVTLRTVGALRQYPYSSLYNLRLCDAAARSAVLHDLHLYKKHGGGAIVENTTYGLGRDLALMKEVSRASGVHVVAGTGHYIAELQSAAARAATVEHIYTLMRRELLDGCCEEPGVRAGFMGEIASVWPLHGTLTEEAALLEFAELGCYCQLDLFGTECSLYQLSPDTDMPSDAQRLDKVALLVRDGRADRVLLSHDIHTKHRLTEFGGHGYSHIINNVLPRMLRRGIPQTTVHLITVTNPAAWLSVSPH